MFWGLILITHCPSTCSGSHRRLFGSTLLPKAIEVPEIATPPSDSEDVPSVESALGGGDERQARRKNYKKRQQIGPARSIALNELEVGKSYSGAIVNIKDFGAFVNIGCRADGLVPIGRIKAEFIKNVADHVTIGQDVQVRIVSVNPDKNQWQGTLLSEEEEQRIAQGSNRSYSSSSSSPPSSSSSYNVDDVSTDGPKMAAPRQARSAKPSKPRRETPRGPPVTVGEQMEGIIESVTSFGCFIDLGSGRKGLLHESQMCLAEGMSFNADTFKTGDAITVTINSVKNSKIDLTQKTPEEIAAEKELREKGLSSTIDVPEGSGVMATLMARAGINASLFAAPSVEEEKPKKTRAPRKKKEETEAAAPVVEEESKTEESEPIKAAEAAAPVVEEESKNVEAAPKKKEQEAAPAASGVSASLVKQLRDDSGAGMMDCKKALSECNGDIEKAKEFLRKKGLASADKKAGRIAAEGAVWSYIHAGSRLGVLVEVNCETDFVARGDVFKELVNDIAMQIVACPEVSAVNKEDVPAEELEKERAIEMQKEDILSKPENMRAKIVDGRVEKIAKARALMEQAYIKDTSKSVAEVVKAAVASIGENIQIRRFTRFNLGEGIEVAAKGDFAAEVEAQTASMAAKAAEKKEQKEEEVAAEDAPKPVALTEISASAVKDLRVKTGAGMMDCKKALAECGGDVEKASEFLRKKGLASADKKAGRVAAEGAVGAYIHAGSRLGVIVEVNCETDFVARGEVFKALVNDVAMQIAACPDVRFVASGDVPAAVLERERALEMQKEDLASKPENIRAQIVDGRVAKIGKEMALMEQQFIKDTSKTVAEHIKEQIATIGENIQVRRFDRFVLGEGVEKKVVDFAAEVAAQTGGLA